MLTERERQVVEGFRRWAKALREDDKAALREIEIQWLREERKAELRHATHYRRGAF